MVRALCGLPPAALVGKPGAEIWPPFVWDPLEASMRKAVETGQRQTYELAFTVPSGDVNYRHWIVLPLALSGYLIQVFVGPGAIVKSARRIRRKADQVSGDGPLLDLRIALGEPVDRGIL
jgi:hypothetical protein